jgi:hypothetical protein
MPNPHNRDVARWAVVHLDEADIARSVFEHPDWDTCDAEVDRRIEHSDLGVYCVVVAEYIDGTPGFVPGEAPN